LFYSNGINEANNENRSCYLIDLGVGMIENIHKVYMYNLSVFYVKEYDAGICIYPYVYL